jgi:hypothetical protein
MATWVIPSSASQSDKASRSRVSVPNPRTSISPSGCCPGGIGGHPTGHHRLLMDIQAGTMREDHVHGSPPRAGRAGGIPSCRDSTLHALLPPGSWRHSRVPSGIQVQTTVQARGTKSKPTSRPAQLDTFYMSAVVECSSGPFSSLRVPTRGMATTVARRNVTRSKTLCGSMRPVMCVF